MPEPGPTNPDHADQLNHPALAEFALGTAGQPPEESAVNLAKHALATVVRNTENPDIHVDIAGSLCFDLSCRTAKSAIAIKQLSQQETTNHSNRSTTLPPPELTYVVSTTLTPEQLQAVGCNWVRVAVLDDGDVYATMETYGETVIEGIIDVLQLSPRQQRAIPSWETLTPEQKSILLATANIREVYQPQGTLTIAQQLLAWFDRHQIWDWFLPRRDWLDCLEDLLSHVATDDRKPAVHVIVDNDAPWTDHLCDTATLYIQRLLTKLEVNDVCCTALQPVTEIVFTVPKDWLVRGRRRLSIPPAPDITVFLSDRTEIPPRLADRIDQVVQVTPQEIAEAHQMP